MNAFPQSISTFIRSPVSRISFGLVMLTVSLLLVSDLLGLIPSASRAELQVRKSIAESLAIQISLSSARENYSKIDALFESVQSRNERIVSIAVVSKDGEMMSGTDLHQQSWTLGTEKKSTPTQTRLGIYAREGKWGELQIVFAPLHQSVGRAGSSAITWLILYFCAGGFLAYFIFLKRILKELDPNQVLPDRVRSALDTLSEGLMILDTQGVIMFSNQSLADRLGVKPQKLVGSNSSSLRWLDGTVESNDDVLPLSDELLPWNRSLLGESIEQGALVALEVSPNKVFKFAVNTSVIQTGKNSIRGVLVTLSDISEIEKQRNDLQQALSRLEVTQREISKKNEELFKLATRDSLTDVLNRRAFFEAFDSLFEDAKSAEAKLGCVMVDIDKFKSVNDNHGHGVGDLVIQYLASVLVHHSRESDVVARFGGEEFCMILPDTSIVETAKIAEAMRLHIEQGIDASYRDKLSITSSFGVSALPSDVENSQQLLDYADRALYYSKENGRNQVAIYDQEKITPAHALSQSGQIGQTIVTHPDAANDASNSAALQGSQRTAKPVVIPDQLPHFRSGDASVAGQLSIDSSPANHDMAEATVAGEAGRGPHERRSNPGATVAGQGAKVLYEPGFSITSRHLLLFNIDQCIRRSKTEDTLTALIILDTRAIQQISNTLGYSNGSRVGAALIERLKNLLRSNDVISQTAIKGKVQEGSTVTDTDAENISVNASVSRSEGDEIVMLISDIKSKEDIGSIVNRIKMSFESPFSIDARELSLDSCMGISISPVDANSAAQMLQNASIATAKAVKSGRRNEICFYSKDLDKTARRRFQLQTDIHKAAERGEFRLAYQPKYSVETGELTGFEALLRWNHPTLGQVSASEFVSLAEELDLISVISTWSVCAAMDQLVGWRKQGHKQYSVAVNLSASELNDPGVAGFIIEQLEQRHLTPDAIEIEITETTGVESSVRAARSLTTLSDYGFTIAIDDFGTGFASLSYLQLFPVDRIKIDRSIVTNVDSNERNAQLVRAIISLGSCMNISILAEGVETREELTFLQDYGCNQVQGYFLEKPMEADRVFKLLTNQRLVSQKILQSKLRLWGTTAPDDSSSAQGRSAKVISLPVSGIGAVVSPFPSAETRKAVMSEDAGDGTRSGTDD